MKNIKFKDLASNGELNYLSNNKTTLKAEDMALILGGAGCVGQICENGRDVGVEKYCQGENAACISGIGVCLNKTEVSSPVLPAFSNTTKLKESTFV